MHYIGQQFILVIVICNSSSKIAGLCVNVPSCCLTKLLCLDHRNTSNPQGKNNASPTPGWVCRAKLTIALIPPWRKVCATTKVL